MSQSGIDLVDYVAHKIPLRLELQNCMTEFGKFVSGEQIVNKDNGNYIADMQVNELPEDKYLIVVSDNYWNKTKFMLANMDPKDMFVINLGIDENDVEQAIPACLKIQPLGDMKFALIYEAYIVEVHINLDKENPIIYKKLVETPRIECTNVQSAVLNDRIYVACCSDGWKLNVFDAQLQLVQSIRVPQINQLGACGKYLLAVGDQLTVYDSQLQTVKTADKKQIIQFLPDKFVTMKEIFKLSEDGKSITAVKGSKIDQLEARYMLVKELDNDKRTALVHNECDDYAGFVWILTRHGNITKFDRL